MSIRHFEEFYANSLSKAQIDADIYVLNAISHFYIIKIHPALPHAHKL